MAVIIKNNDIEDYFVERTLGDIEASAHGLIPEYENNRLIILKDHRLSVDYDAFSMMNTETIDADPQIRKALKKLSSVNIMDASEASSNAVHRAVFDILCRGDREVFNRVQGAMNSVHQQVLELFRTCFPGYEYFRIIPSVRLTRTLFENLHWDNHSIDDDFQQVRIFVNLDSRPRIWNVSHNFVTYARDVYTDNNLSRFAGRDPNEMNNYIVGKLLGGTANACKDPLPRHVVSFDPGEVWFGESRMISHQIYYGERAMVYMFLVKPENMLDQSRRFNAQVESLHAAFA